MAVVEQFLKIYLPSFAVLLYFSGFHYINEYYRFFGLIGFYKNFTALEFGFFSFGVFRELLIFVDLESSIRSFLLIIFLLTLYFLPNLHASIPLTPRWLVGANARSAAVPLLPAPVRVAIALISSFLVLFNVSGRIGDLHGCEKLRDSRSSIEIHGLNLSPMSAEQQEFFKRLQKNGELVELWSTDKFLYVGKRIRNCAIQNRTTFKFGVEDFKYYTVTKLKRRETADGT